MVIKEKYILKRRRTRRRRNKGEKRRPQIAFSLWMSMTLKHNSKYMKKSGEMILGQQIKIVKLHFKYLCRKINMAPLAKFIM